MFLISVEGPRRRMVKNERKRERERHYEVLENVKSLWEECEESTLIKRKENTSFSRREESENVSNKVGS